MDKALRWLYVIAVGVAVFTGFGNMPLYKRYYVSDLRGLGWSGDFFANLYVHYLAGACVLGISAYFLLGYLFRQPPGRRITVTGLIRGIVLALTLMTGLLMAAKNLPSVNYSLGLLLFTNFSHLAMAFCLLLLSILCTIGRYGWTRRP